MRSAWWPLEALQPRGRPRSNGPEMAWAALPLLSIDARTTVRSGSTRGSLQSLPLIVNGPAGRRSHRGTCRRSSRRSPAGPGAGEGVLLDHGAGLVGAEDLGLDVWTSWSGCTWYPEIGLAQAMR